MTECSPLQEIRSLVLSGFLWLSAEAELDIASGIYSLNDIRSCIILAHGLRAADDEMAESCDGRKYCIFGPDAQGYSLVAVGKLIDAGDGRVFFLITSFPGE